jgi:pimeloyl-ACP methyl ester carboxylesterase
VRELQPPLVLFHGYLGSAAVWDGLRVGDRRLITPDLLGHGDNVAREFAPDAIVDDALGTVAPLGEYDLAGYSLGARTAVRMLVRGARPRRAVIAGTGMDGIVHAMGRGERYRSILTGFGTFAPGSFGARTEELIRATGGDPAAMVHILDAFVDTPVEALAAIDLPVLIVIGDRDRDRDSAEDLAKALGDARLEVIPGDHMRAPSSPRIADAILRFLD